jgi:hypothetical protein
MGRGLCFRPKEQTADVGLSAAPGAEQSGQSSRLLGVSYDLRERRSKGGRFERPGGCSLQRWAGDQKAASAAWGVCSWCFCSVTHLCVNVEPDYDCDMTRSGTV